MSNPGELLLNLSIAVLGCFQSHLRLHQLLAEALEPVDAGLSSLLQLPEIRTALIDILFILPDHPLLILDLLARDPEQRLHLPDGVIDLTGVPAVLRLLPFTFMKRVACPLFMSFGSLQAGVVLTLILFDVSVPLIKYIRFHFDVMILCTVVDFVQRY